MKITATSSGGFAGVTRTHEVDTATSPHGAALEAALASAALLDAAPEAIGADIPRWTITLEGAGQRRTISFAEDGNPASAPLRSLVEQILAA
jgi:hypothetical protein